MGYVALAGTAFAASSPTALDRYVAAPDTNYTFKLLKTTPTPVGSIYLVEMISQAWLTTNEVDRPVWRHWLNIAVPTEVASQTGLLFITGGNNDKGPPKGPDGNLARIAVETKSVAVELRNVPNQPLEFRGDGHRRVEDDLIAYSWDQYIKLGDDRWPARLPMTKAAVRAMDTVTKFCSQLEGGGVKVERFVVAGGSKRGWTTWTTAAVDKRVVACVPIVIDVLNLDPSMRHHYAAYGFWAPAVGNYTEHHIMDWINTPEFARLMEIEDPYAYRQRYTMPKLIINATGDQFFLPDSSQYYWNDLPGPKYLRYVPNTDHSLRDSDAWETIQTFYQALLRHTALPDMAWSFDPDGFIRVQPGLTPVAAKLWQATNPKARDFRLATLGPKWTSTPLTIENGRIQARVAEPAQGWTAFLDEVTYELPNRIPLKLTSAVRVLPDRVDHQWKPDKTAITGKADGTKR